MFFSILWISKAGCSLATINFASASIGAWEGSVVFCGVYFWTPSTFAWNHSNNKYLLVLQLPISKLSELVYRSICFFIPINFHYHHVGCEFVLKIIITMWRIEFDWDYKNPHKATKCQIKKLERIRKKKKLKIMDQKEWSKNNENSIKITKITENKYFIFHVLKYCTSRKVSKYSGVVFVFYLFLSLLVHKTCSFCVAFLPSQFNYSVPGLLQWKSPFHEAL